MSGEHAGFIVAAYAIAAAVVGMLIGSLVVDHRNLKKALAKLPARDDRGEV